MTTDELYMARALQLARQSLGYHAPNPLVGAVIVHQGRILGEGFHQRYGQAHAEVNAVADVAESDRPLLAESTIYVTLEPCFHTGKTPPCVDLILRHRIPRVVVACRDPFPLVAGQSIQKLCAAGVEVQEGVLRAEAEALNVRFFTALARQRPHVLLKFAVSRDGFLGKPDRRVPISCPTAQRLVHKWRTEEMAILVGTNTALLDNPVLDNRLYFGRAPLRLVLDRSLRLPPTLRLLSDGRPTWVFTEMEPPALPADSPLRYVRLHFGTGLLGELLGYLHQQKINSLLVEGGARLLQSFLDQGLWDEARVLRGAVSLGSGVEAPCIEPRYFHHTDTIGQTQLDFYHRL